QHVRLAVTPPAGVVLHEKTINTLGGLQWGYEFWQRSDPPYSYRVIKGPTEAAFTGSTIETYDPATNTISAQPDPQPKLYDDPVAKLRELLAKGDAQVIGTTTIDGRDVLKIVAHSSNDMLFNGTIYVDTKSYRPVLAEIQQNAYDCGHSSPCSGLERIRFLAYEYLPATADTLRLVSLEAQHPGASVAAAPAPTDTSTGQTATTPQASSKPT